MNTTITGIYPIDKEDERGEDGTWELSFEDNHLYMVFYKEFQLEDSLLGWVDKKLDSHVCIKYNAITFVERFWSNGTELWGVRIVCANTESNLFMKNEKPITDLFNQIKEKYLNA